MKFSTRVRYGLKAMLELSACYNTGLISIREISERRNVPLQYLEQLFKKLRAAGLVQAERGAYGGYRLSRSPEDISVGDVIRTLDGSLAPVDCAREDFDCEYSELCTESKLYRRIRESMDEVVDSTTLLDMLREEQSTQDESVKRTCLLENTAAEK